MTPPEGFSPVRFDGPYERERYAFLYQGGAVIPLVAWADACDPDLPAMGDFSDAHYRAMGLDLPLGPGEIAQACEALFGPARPKEGRDYPRGADWVVTTPEDGVYLTVCLDADDVNRFGFGLSKVLPAKGRDEFLAREIRIQRALTDALRPIRQAMAPSQTPAP